MSAPTPDAIGELRQLAIAATRGGPWCTRGRSVYLDHWHVMPRVAEADTKVDADWIAAVSPTVGLVLLAEIDRLRAELAAAQEREARVRAVTARSGSLVPDNGLWVRWDRLRAALADPAPSGETP